jgi:hypothetical protein
MKEGEIMNDSGPAEIPGVPVIRGFTLVEVMIALCLIMLCIFSVSKLSVLAFHSKSYGECLTRATVLGNAQLNLLRDQPLTSPDLKKDWHQDGANPIKSGAAEFYRFWSVEDLPQGKEVTVFVAWHDRQMGRATDFSSLEGLKASRCPRMQMAEFIRSE